MAAPSPDDLARRTADPGWAQAFRDVPREHFIPDAAWADPMGPAPGHWIDRTIDPGAWREAVYSDSVIVTQIEDGATELTAESSAQTTGFTSSSSAPSHVLDFLGLLDPSPGDRVLEIGTGTGWTCALLAARIGAENVTSIEVDEDIAEQAAANLDRAGFTPHLVVGDGARGAPERAPFDRVHVTCGVREVPYAWVAQTRPGGVIVAPWMPGNGGHKLRLTVTGDSAVGRFHGDCGYMMMRAQRPAAVTIADDERESIARVDPRRIDRTGTGFQVALQGAVPGITAAGGASADGTFLLVLSDGSGSHARARHAPGSGRTQVVQRGPQNLWDEVEAAYLRWVGWGEPGRDRFGLTVTREGHHIWLDTPDNHITGA